MSSRFRAYVAHFAISVDAIAFIDSSCTTVGGVMVKHSELCFRLTNVSTLCSLKSSFLHTPQAPRFYVVYQRRNHLFVWHRRGRRHAHECLIFSPRPRRDNNDAWRPGQKLLIIQHSFTTLLYPFSVHVCRQCKRQCDHGEDAPIDNSYLWPPARCQMQHHDFAISATTPASTGSVLVSPACSCLRLCGSFWATH